MPSIFSCKEVGYCCKSKSGRKAEIYFFHQTVVTNYSISQHPTNRIDALSNVDEDKCSHSTES